MAPRSCWRRRRRSAARAELADKADRDDHRVPRRQRRRRDRPRAASAISQRSGQNVVVLNRDGAAGTLGFGALAAAAPDGHTIAFGPTTPVANAPYLVKGVRYNVESFSYICQVFENVFTIAVGPQSKIKSAQELFAAAKQSRQADLWPCRARHDSAPVDGEPGRSAQAAFASVPFAGDAPLVPALLRGEIDFAAIGGFDHPSAAVDPAARDLHRQAPSGLSGRPDREGARRRNRRAARPQRLVCAGGHVRRTSAARSKASCRRFSSRIVLKVMANTGQIDRISRRRGVPCADRQATTNRTPTASVNESPIKTIRRSFAVSGTSRAEASRSPRLLREEWIAHAAPAIIRGDVRREAMMVDRIGHAKARLAPVKQVGISPDSQTIQSAMQ